MKQYWEFTDYQTVVTSENIVFEALSLGLAFTRVHVT